MLTSHRKSELSRMEDTDGVDVDRQYAFAVITHEDDYGRYYVGQVVPVEWEGGNNPREVGIGGVKPGKLNAGYELFDDLFEAVDFARELQEDDLDSETKYNLSPDVQVSAYEAEGMIGLRWTSKHVDVITVDQGYAAIRALAGVLPPQVDAVDIIAEHVFKVEESANDEIEITVEEVVSAEPPRMINDLPVTNTPAVKEACELCGDRVLYVSLDRHERFGDLKICVRCLETLADMERRGKVTESRINLVNYLAHRVTGGELSPKKWRDLQYIEIDREKAADTGQEIIQY